VVHVKKKNGESTESLMRRFTKRVQSSGVLIRAKKGKFYEPPKNRRAKREVAARKKLIQDKKEFLKKIGKLDEYIDPKRPSKRGQIKKMLKARVK